MRRSSCRGTDSRSPTRIGRRRSSSAPSGRRAWRSRPGWCCRPTRRHSCARTSSTCWTPGGPSPPRSASPTSGECAISPARWRGRPSLRGRRRASLWLPVSISDGAEFFLELLLEEMPAGAIPGARADLVRKFTDELAQAALSAEAITADATPRRLFVCARGLARRQEDRVVEVTGPPAEKAMDSDGNPTPMAVGFARAQGVAVTDLRRVRTASGEALLARKAIRGRPAAEILAEAAPRVLRSMTFPKMMRWGAGEHPFVRPLHRIIALYDGEVVPFEIFGVRSGRATLGHRLSDGSEITVASFDDYLGKMRAAGVEPDSSERTARLLEAARRLAAEAGGSIEANADLVPLLSDLVEWPGLVRGSFDPRYLELPEEVLVTTMRVHQK